MCARLVGYVGERFSRACGRVRACRWEHIDIGSKRGRKQYQRGVVVVTLAVVREEKRCEKRLHSRAAYERNETGGRSRAANDKLVVSVCANGDH